MLDCSRGIRQSNTVCNQFAILVNICNYLLKAESLISSRFVLVQKLHAYETFGYTPLLDPAFEEEYQQGDKSVQQPHNL